MFLYALLAAEVSSHCNIDRFLDGNEDKYENYISEGLKEKSRKEEKDFEENLFEKFDLED